MRFVSFSPLAFLQGDKKLTLCSASVRFLSQQLNEPFIDLIICGS